ncbi:DUF916 and DUF3324 domain-containing protein [Carnobacterium gallinarum]|uniref:DUF916 and DUF3324 domain-containing protein n=1 Tax=Carnobacterium gallinarum TaxID=2749 RepID=UPI0005539DF3|nr:DUF916 and DUF3324 domain-containing protein [Carnobacterium gallinarum]
MYKKIKSIWLIGILVLMMTVASIHPIKVEAADQGMSFSVSAIRPDNQIDKEQSYFDLKMTPGQEQEIEVQMTNSSDREITVEVGVNAAITNSKGVIDYSWNLENTLELAKENNKDKKNEPIDVKEIVYDSTLKYPIPDITTSEKEVKIPAKSDFTYKIKIKMPKESFDGVILGGIRFTEKDDPNKKTEGQKGVQIENKFAYAIGLLLRETETKVAPDMKMAKDKIKPASLNGHNAVLINLQNTEMAMMRDLSVDAKIYKKGASEVLHEATQNSLKMAPNSNFNYAVDWSNQALKAGTYTVKLHAENKASAGETEEMNRVWDFEEDFTITADEAKKINDKALELEKEPIQWWIYAIIGGLLLLLLLVIAYLIKRHLDKKKEEERRRKMKAARARKKRKNQGAERPGVPRTSKEAPKKKRPSKK